MNKKTVTENDVVSVYIPHIKKLCTGKWTNLEMDDRVAEAALCFTCALRNLPINCGHFWEDYCEALTFYMDQLNRGMPSRYFSKTYSLDCPINTRNPGSKITLLDILEDPRLDDSSFFVDSFMETLSLRDNDIIRDLMEKVPRALVARKHNLSLNSLKKHLNVIGYSYLKE